MSPSSSAANTLPRLGSGAAKAGIAKHLRLRLRLEEKIRAGTYPLATRLPTRRELMRMHGCSTVTVARALGEMVQDGIVERRRRTGTFATALPPRLSAPAFDPAATTLGLFHAGFPQSFHPYYSGLLEGLTRSANVGSFALELLAIPPEGPILDADFQARYGVAGFVATVARSSELQAAAAHNIPCVCMCSAFPEPSERAPQ